MKTKVGALTRLSKSLMIASLAAMFIPALSTSANAENIQSLPETTCKEVLANWGLITIGNDGSIAENITMDGQAPYEVSTINQLYCIGAGSFVVETDGSNDTISNTGVDCRSQDHDAVLVELMHARYIQTADLDFADLTVDNATHWRPISNNGCQFMGEYDGNSKKISNLYFNQPTLTSDNRPYEGIGLFGSTGDNTYAPAGTTRTTAVIKNVILENAYIVGYQDVGGIVGIADANTVINNVSVSGTIGVSQLGYGDLGGIVGWTNGAEEKPVTIQNVTVDIEFQTIVPDTPTTNEPWCVGGVVGYADWTHVSDSQSDVIVNSQIMSGVAGLMGCQYNGSVSRSFSTGNYNNVSDTNDTTDVAGLVSSLANSTITDSYSIATLSGDVNLAGLVNWAKNSTLTRSYAATTITILNDTTVTEPTVGGLIASLWDDSPNTVQSSFWDQDVTRASTSVNGGTGRTSAEMKTLATFVDAGWDIVEGTNDTKVWGISPQLNGGYPFLQALGGQRTEQNPSGNQNNNAPIGNSPAPTIQQQFGSRELMQSITPEVFSQIAPEQLASLPISSIRGITKEVVAGMTLAQLRALTPTQIRVMRPSVLAALPAEWLSKLSAKQVKHLLPRQIRVLSEQQLQKFTSKQRSVIASVLRKATKQSK